MQLKFPPYVGVTIRRGRFINLVMKIDSSVQSIFNLYFKQLLQVSNLHV